ncbi:ankyrin [Amniculicola lignicola CBS 123094]|uniref:Ankyrin n=1 Tax=Amniculicola lignicola CBS 123094 TaxID=1392246 RepID=A0A6A5WVK3_9PLEO|nr:ankyrin [Amniculicola lignicola CBS 123094]
MNIPKVIPFRLDRSVAAMSLLPTKTPPGWSSSTEDLEASADLAAFLTATNRMKKYEPEQLESIAPLSHGSTFQARVCKDTESGTLVVVKALRAEETTSSQKASVPASVVQEMLISVWPPFLSHPNITQTLGFQRYLEHGDRETITLVLEYAQSGSLDAYFRHCNSASPWGCAQMRALALDVASGLECLHQCSVLHGDLKPDNILLFQRTGSGEAVPYMAKLVDFGNAIVDDAYTKTFRDADSAPIYCGTDWWILPKVIDLCANGGFQALALCDVFSFALVLWSIYKGSVFYDASWKEPGESDRNYLEKAKISDFTTRFESFVKESIGRLPDQEIVVLREVFQKCIQVVAEHEAALDTNQEREMAGMEADMASVPFQLQLMTAVRGTLQANGDVRTPFQPTHWYQFNMGEAHIDKNDNIPWATQAKYYTDLLRDVHDGTVSRYKKGAKYLELAVCASIGFGCKKSIDATLDHLHSANCLSDFVAQLTVPRLFQANGKEPLEPEDLVLDEEDLRDIEDEEDQDSSRGDNDEMSDGSEDGGGEDDVEDEESESGPGHPTFEFSKLLPFYFERTGLGPERYYCWHICKTRDLMMSLEAGESFILGNETMQGLTDPRLPKVALARLATGENLEIRTGGEDSSERDSLHNLVARAGENGFLKQLLKEGADPNGRERVGRPVLLDACRSGNRLAIDLLLEAGAKANIPGRDGELPLHWLFMFEGEDLDTVCSELIGKGEADINAAMDQFGLFNESYNHLMIFGTALHAAIAARSLVAVRVLTKHGADINLRPYEDSETPIELAARLHMAEIVDFLGNRGATLANDVNGGWALHSVASHVNPLRRWMIHGSDFEKAAGRVVEVLVDLANRQNISLDMEDNEGLTAFDVAICEHGEDAYVLASFLQQGFLLDESSLDLAITGCSSDEENASKVDLVLRNWPEMLENVCSALKVAIEVGALAAMRVLKHKFGAKIFDYKDESETTPMHWAVKAGIKSIVDYLINSKASLDGIDMQGVPPLGLALLLRRTEIFKLLYASGANLIVAGGPWNGSSVLVFAVSIKHSSAVAMIGFLLSGDLEEWEPFRFPQLHEQGILDAQNKATGNTLLHDAALAADLGAVESIIRAGANPQAQNFAGRTARQEAQRKLAISSGIQSHTLLKVTQLL